MKTTLTFLALLAAGAAYADETALARLCSESGGQLKRVAVSGVQRLDCAGPKVAWFRVLTGGNSIVGHYEATRDGAWRPALEAALADLEVICGELPPQLQYGHRKLIADCGSDRK
jgi:hypothetical protein